MKERWHLFNNLRIVRVGEEFMIQKKWLFRWRFMSSLGTWQNHWILRWEPSYRVKYPDHESAHKAAIQMKAHFHPRTEVEDYGTV